MTPRYSVGQIVCLRVDPSRQGPVIVVLPSVRGQAKYLVYHSPTESAEYFEDQLAPLMSQQRDPITAGLVRGDWLNVDAFRARLTAARLAHPLVDTLYALHAARIKFIPFQFKPLLRFLRADRPRLLIADEVGVGKTIEAGLILKELQSRQRVENVLIVCPKALVSKWRAEMLRFDEDFRILGSNELHYCLREAHLDGAWPQEYARSIVHLELLRGDDYMIGTNGRRPNPGLQTLDPPPQFSLTIVDEAHHVRNPGTNSYELARILCDLSEAVVNEILRLATNRRKYHNYRSLA